MDVQILKVIQAAKRLQHKVSVHKPNAAIHEVLNESWELKKALTAYEDYLLGSRAS